MTPDGVGDLYVAFEQMKRKLDAEGLFDPAHKETNSKSLPASHCHCHIVCWCSNPGYAADLGEAISAE